jgi:DNA-binding IscR family transcriptional regulator
MEVRNAAAKILEHTTLADIVNPKFVKTGKRLGKKTHEDARVLPMVVPGNPRRRED